MTDIKLYAFWSYTTYPYVLGGEVTDMREDGCVKISSYGNGYWFKPLKILPLAAGQLLMEQIKELSNQYHEKLSDFHRKFDISLRELIPEVKISR